MAVAAWFWPLRAKLQSNSPHAPQEFEQLTTKMSMPLTLYAPMLGNPRPFLDRDRVRDSFSELVRSCWIFPWSPSGSGSAPKRLPEAGLRAPKLGRCRGRRLRLPGGRPTQWGPPRRDGDLNDAMVGLFSDWRAGPAQGFRAPGGAFSGVRHGGVGKAWCLVCWEQLPA